MKEEDISLILEFGRTFKSFNSCLQKEFEAAGSELPFEIWIKLFLFSSVEDSIQKSLADYSGIHKATITRIIDILQEKGFVERIQDQNDRRQNLVTVTGEGMKEIEKYFPLIQSTEKKFFNGIDSEEIIIFKKVLDTIWDNCRKYCNDDNDRSY